MELTAEQIKQKIYYQNNKDAYQRRYKEYYNINKDKINQYNKLYWKSYYPSRKTMLKKLMLNSYDVIIKQNVRVTF